MPIAKLSIDFEARLGQFETELKRITSVADGVSSKLNNAFKGIALGIAGIGAGVGLSTLKDKFDQAIASAAGLKEMADKTGASVENLSGLGAVAKITATDMGLIETALNKLSKGLHASDEDAKGTGKALEFLGLKMKDLRGKDSAENLKLVADKMAELEDGTGKVALAMALFGKNGASMLAFMKDLAESGELQIKTTEAQAVAAKNFEEDLRRLAATKEALYKVVSLELAPAFDTFVRALIGAKNETNGMIQTGKDLAADGSIREWGIQATQVAAFVIDAFDGVSRVVKGIGITLGAAAAQIAAISNGSLAQFNGVAKEYRADLDELSNKPLFSQKLQIQTDALRAHWAQVVQVKKAYASFPKDVQNAALKSLEESFYGTSGGTRSASEFTAAADPRNAKSSAGTSKVDDYTKLIQSLNEKIAVEQLNIDTVGKASAAEKDYAKYQADVASGAVKLTGAQKSVVDAYYQTYLIRTKEREFADAVDKQTEANRLQVVAMEDQIRALDTQAEQYGLTERAINSMTEARLEEAIAIARSKDVDEESIAVLEKELLLRQKLGKAMENRDTSAILSQTEDAKAAKKEAEKALLDRKLAAGDISQRQYEQGMKVIEGEFDTMGEFAKRAAQNMQDAMAEFFIDPTAKGMQSIAESFGKAVQKMIAQAAAAQLGKLLFGDMDKSGNLGGLFGSIFGSSASSMLKKLGGPWFGDYFGTGGASLGSGAFDAIFSNPALFANGGIMTSAGPLPLNSYAGGGIANRPQVSLFGEGRTPEAYVPLPDGKRIPVAMSGGGEQRSIVVNVNSSTGDPAEIRRSAAAGARTALGLMSRSRRYA